MSALRRGFWSRPVLSSTRHSSPARCVWWLVGRRDMSDDIKKKLWGDTPQKQLHPILENDLAELLDRLSISFHDTNLNGCNFNPEALTVLADYAKHLLEKENAEIGR